MRVSAPGADRPVRLATIERVSPPAFAPAGVFNRCSAALIGQFFWRLGALGFLSGGGLTLLLPLSILR